MNFESACFICLFHRIYRCANMAWDKNGLRVFLDVCIKEIHDDPIWLDLIRRVHLTVHLNTMNLFRSLMCDKRNSFIQNGEAFLDLLF